MALENMFANHIAAAKGGYEPQRQNNCILYITLEGDNVGAASGTGVNPSILELALKTFPIPKRTMNVLEYGYLNETRKFAGKPTYDDLQVVYGDFVDKSVHSLLQKWNYLVHNPENGLQGLAANYKKSGWVSLFSPDGQIERRYDLIGVWPSAFDPGDADMDSDDYLRINITLTIDKAIPREGLNPDSVSA